MEQYTLATPGCTVRQLSSAQHPNLAACDAPGNGVHSTLASIAEVVVCCAAGLYCQQHEAPQESGLVHVQILHEERQQARLTHIDV